jgi:hypothetical protein
MGFRVDLPRPITEHPLLTMWRDRLEAELAHEQVLAARRLAREAEHVAWHEAWRDYKAHANDLRSSGPLPRWWNIPGWTMWLLRLPAPGRPNKPK